MLLAGSLGVAAAQAKLQRQVALDRATIERSAAAIKPIVVDAPARALPNLARLQSQASQISNASDRALASAAVAHLQAEAELRLGHFDIAEPIIARSIMQVRKLAPRSRLLSDLLLTRGALNVERAKVALALADFHEAFHLFRRFYDDRSQAKALLNIAYLYFEAKDYGSVLKYTLQAKQIFQGDPMIALTIHNNRALALTELRLHRQAESEYTIGLSITRSMRSGLLEAQVLRNLARTRLMTGRLAEAARTIAEARRVAPPRLGSPEDRASDAIEAQIAFDQGRLDAAERLIAQNFAGVDLARTQLSSREAHETAYRIYAARGNAPAALVHLAAQKRLDDEATKLATTTSTALMGARFDFANQELKIANLQRDEARRSVAFERARLASQRAMFLGGAGAVAVIILLLLVGLFTIRRSRDRVRLVAADLKISNDALGKALAAKTEFLATTSHEIRTPLNGILGMTQVILTDRTLAPTLRDRLQLVHAAGTTMRALVDDILDVAKMETGNLTIEDRPFDPAATLRDAALLWQDQARARGIAFRIDLDECPSAMMGDAARVRQVAFNLMSNAFKFTRQGSVTLRARREGDRFVLTVSDTGVGIPPDKLEAIFESFRQADAGTTREFGGTGLGLSICRSLAEAMGGSVRVASALGCGSTFTVTLPFREPETAGAATATERASALLLIERNPIARAMLRTLFEARTPTAFAASEEEALAWLAENNASAVLADAMTLSVAGQRAVSRSVGDGPLFLLCGDTATAMARAGDGWRTLAKPILGVRLVAAVIDQGVVSGSDTLATKAA
jgi:signal transduction histidine kinase